MYGQTYIESEIVLLIEERQFKINENGHPKKCTVIYNCSVSPVGQPIPIREHIRIMSERSKIMNIRYP